MKQFGKILRFELKHYLKNKIFAGVTIFLVLLIAGIMCFPRMTAVFKMDNESNTSTELSVMLIKVEDITQAEMLGQAFSAVFTGYDVQNSDEDIEVIKNKIISGDAECAFVITGPTAYTYFVNNLSMHDSNDIIATEVLQQVYQMNAMINEGMTLKQAEEVMNVEITGKVENLGKNQIQNFFYTYIMVFALYFAILLYGQMVATNVASEKSSRAMEVLITSTKSTPMMFGKVLAPCLAGMFQLIAIFGSAFVFYNFNKSYWENNMIVESIFNIPRELLVYMLVFFILGFLVYAFMFGAVGSTVSKLEDINTAVMPITLMFIIAFFVAMFSMSSGNINNTIIKICSFIPFTSPMSMFTRIAMSTVAGYEITISIIILIGAVIGIGFVSAKIYRVGVLLYGTTPKLKTILKAVWKS